MNPDKAIDAAYNSHIAALYKTLSQSILSANGNEVEITASEARFQRGLAHAEETRTRARRLAGLD